MKRLYLHGGHFKTGTTALQLALAEHRALLAENGILYPLWEDSLPTFQHGPRLGFWNPTRATWLEEAFGRRVAEIRDAPENHVVLSAETVSSYDRPAFERFKRVVGPDFEIVLVLGLRHWAGFLPSRWREDVRFGDSLSFEEMMSRLTEDFDASSYGDFSIIPRAAAGLVHEVRMVPYDRAQGVKALLAALDIPSSLSIALLEATTVANESMDYLTQETLRLSNMIFAEHHGRARDDVYLSSKGKFGRLILGSRKVQAFLGQGSAVSKAFIARLEGAKITRPVSDWASVFDHWKAVLNQRLGALGLDRMPEDWGADESGREVSYTTLTLSDLEPVLREALGAAVLA